MSYSEMLYTRGANKTFADVFGKVLDEASKDGIKFTIKSVWRDPKKQAEMLSRWNAGNRTGLRVKPATTSLHCLVNSEDEPDSLACDLQANEADLFEIGQRAKKQGLRWGGDFQSKDTIHFDGKGLA